MPIEKEEYPEGRFYSRDTKDESAQSDEAVGVAVFILHPCIAFALLIDDLSAFAGVRFKRNCIWCDTKVRVQRLEFKTFEDEYGKLISCRVYTKTIATDAKDLTFIMLGEADYPVQKRLSP